MGIVKTRSNEFIIVQSENPFIEMWSRLSYFESEYNAQQYLKERFSLPDENLMDIAKSLAYTMKTAKEYYESADRVTLLTQPLLLFYGMAALSKVLFTSTYGKESPSKGHGLEQPKPNDFPKIFTRIQKDGAFPQFHSCYSKETLFRRKFTMKELLSLVPEIKVEFETIYDEKSRAVRTIKSRFGIDVIDSEIEKYGNLAQNLQSFFPEIMTVQQMKSKIILWQKEDIPAIRAVSGEKYLVLPLERNDKKLFLPEMSVHFLIMYLLGMISRYRPKEWGEIIEGTKTGEIYIIQKFLETTTRKFPNLILNKLLDRDFVFVTPQFEIEKQLDEEELERIHEYVSRRIAEEVRRRA
jgi:hypothetical protein